jgi:hypothetical protein
MLRFSKPLVEEAPLVINVTTVIADLRRTGDRRGGGFVRAHRGRAEWIGYEIDLDERLLRLDARLWSGATSGAWLELVTQQLGPHEGRVRWFAECPGCGRRIRLVVVSRAPCWGCARCLGMNYRSTRHRRGARAAFAVQKLRVEAGATPGPIWEPIGPKPPRVRERTWSELHSRIATFLNVYAEEREKRRARRSAAK